MLNARLFVVKRDHESNDSRLGCRDADRCRISALRKCASAAFTKLLRSAASDCEKPPHASNGGQFAHDPVEPRVSLEADARTVRERNRTILDSGVIGKTTEVAEDTGIGFGAAKTETGGDGE